MVSHVASVALCLLASVGVVAFGFCVFCGSGLCGCGFWLLWLLQLFAFLVLWLPGRLLWLVVSVPFGFVGVRSKMEKELPSKTKNKEEPIRHLYTSGRTYALAFICFGLLVQWLLTSGLGLIWFRVGF